MWKSSLFDTIFEGMQRLNDTFITTIAAEYALQDKKVLEIGCGNGGKSIALADACADLTAIDPNKNAVASAQRNCTAPNLTYMVGRAEELHFSGDSFDIVIFSLSLHHVPINKMANAINEAARVCRPSGKIIFLEPTFVGTFFDAVLWFGASDADERKEKAIAYFKMLSSASIKEESESFDEISLHFDSESDFIKNMEPSKNLDDIDSFLQAHAYMVHAQRRINVFSVV